MHPHKVSMSKLPSFFLFPGTSELTRLETSYSYDIKTVRNKFESQEQSHVFKLASPESPWNFSLERNLRINNIDKDASRQFLRDEALPSMKYSARIAYGML